MANAEIKRHGPGIKRLLGSAIIGGGLMYFFDPQRGKTRRAKLRDKSRHVLFGVPKCKAARQARRLASFIPDRGLGLMAMMRGRLLDEPVSDEVLVKRVRARLGHVSPHLGSIQVTAHDGEVKLTGSLPEIEREPLVMAASQVLGVKAVVDDLAH